MINHRQVMVGGLAVAVAMGFGFFFFQAEDGIRDHCVTGVQTCALPIFTCAEIFTVGLSEQVMVIWTKALKLAESLHDVPSQLICYLPLWGRKIRAALYDDALDNAQRCAEAANKAPNPGPAAMSEWMLGHTKHHLGRLAEARAHLQRP